MYVICNLTVFGAQLTKYALSVEDVLLFVLLSGRKREGRAAGGRTEEQRRGTPQDAGKDEAGVSATEE